MPKGKIFKKIEEHENEKVMVADPKNVLAMAWGVYMDMLPEGPTSDVFWERIVEVYRHIDDGKNIVVGFKNLGKPNKKVTIYG